MDIWTAYELSWLDPRGKPQIAMATLYFPADSPQLIESKSLKLYLNSFSQTVFETSRACQTTLEQDLSRASGSPLEVLLKSPEVFDQEQIEELSGESLDQLEVEVRDYRVDPDHLAAGAPVVEETLVSNLLKTNCPITGQPELGRYSNPLPGRPDGSKRFASLPGLLPAAPGLSRKLCGEDLHGSLAPLPAGKAYGLCPLHPPRRDRHQSFPHQLRDYPARQFSNRQTVTRRTDFFVLDRMRRL